MRTFHAFAAACLLLPACQTPEPQPPAPEPKKVVVTDIAPSSAVVERSVARVESRVAAAAESAEKVARSATLALEDAIRERDDMEPVLRAIREQVEDLQISVKIADAEAAAMSEEIAALRGQVERVQAERDAARMAEATAQAKHDADKIKWQAERGILAGENERIAGQLEEARKVRAWWMRAALVTWGILLIGGAAVAILKLRMI